MNCCVSFSIKILLYQFQIFVCFQVTVFGNYLYVVGGMSEGDVYLNTAERYDPKINKWTEIQSLSTGKYLMGAGNLMGKFVIVG